MVSARRDAGAVAMVVIAAIATMSSSAAAAEHPTAITGVEIAPTNGVPGWRAAALQQALEREWVHDAEDADAEPTEITALLFRGELSADRLRFTISTTDGSTLVTARVPTTDTTLGAVLAAIAESMSGVEAALLESESEAASLADVEVSTGWLAVILAAFSLFIASPLLISVLGGAKPRTIAALRSFQATVAWTLALAAFVAAALGGALASIASVAWLVYIGAGVFWGWFVAANARIVFPTLHGLSRVEHRDVFRLLRVWAWVASLRLLRRAVFYAPFLGALWLALGLVAPALSLTSPLVLAVVVPVWGLLARFWFLSLVENAAVLLDGQRVVGDASAENAWHQAVRGYFLGYVNRSGLEGGARLLDRILFLPGHGSEITLYGGGLSHSRIVIGTELLEFALAPYGRPHDYEAPREDKLFWSDWHAGLIVPSDDPDKPIASREMRAISHHVEPGDIDPIHIGQPPTLAGFVEPSALDSRHTHRPTEDPTWLEWDPGNDFDGTDPGDHDFLFGALVREVGRVHRFDDQRLTLAEVVSSRASRAPAWLRRLGRVLSTPATVLFGRAHTELGDAYAALNMARHHLVQYLAWQLWGRDEILTARAFAPELERTSEDIGALLETSGAGATDDVDTRKRLEWLSYFSHTPVTSPRARWFRRAGVAAVAALLVTALAQNVMRAIQYHDTYLERTGTGDDAPAASSPTRDEAQP